MISLIIPYKQHHHCTYTITDQLCVCILIHNDHITRTHDVMQLNKDYIQCYPIQNNKDSYLVYL